MDRVADPQPTDPPTGPPAPGPPDDQVPEGKLKSAIRDVLGELGIGKRTQATGEPDIAAQVEAAVQKVQARDARTRAEQAREERLTALEAKTATPEQTPKIMRRATRFMGWDRDGED